MLIPPETERPLLLQRFNKASYYSIKESEEKLRLIDPKTINFALEPVKHIFIKNPDAYAIKFEQYKELITKTKGNPDIVQLAQFDTDNFSSITKMLRETPAWQIDLSKTEFHELSKNLNYMVVGSKKRTMKMNLSHLKTQTRTSTSPYHQRTLLPLIYTSNPNLHIHEFK